MSLGVIGSGSCPIGVIFMQDIFPRGSCPSGSYHRGSCPRTFTLQTHQSNCAMKSADLKILWLDNTGAWVIEVYPS